jgi:hypothetical protein
MSLVTNNKKNNKQSTQNAAGQVVVVRSAEQKYLLLTEFMIHVKKLMPHIFCKIMEVILILSYSMRTYKML